MNKYYYIQLAINILQNTDIKDVMQNHNTRELLTNIYHLQQHNDHYRSGPVAQSVASPTADLGVASSITAQSNTFVEIGHIYGHYFPSADSSRVVSFKRRYLHEVLANR